MAPGSGLSGLPHLLVRSESKVHQDLAYLAYLACLYGLKAKSQALDCNFLTKISH
jgi:hypothetical protein